MRITVTIPDESLIWTIKNNDIDLSILDKIDENIGTIVLSDIMYDFFNNIIKDNVHNVIQRDLWTRYLNKYNLYYYLILDMLEKQVRKLPIQTIINEIDENNKIIRNIIKTYNSGISQYDSHLISFSHYLRKYTHFEPIIISEDSDILKDGNIICSYFGISHGFLSVYELVRILENKQDIEKYLSYKKIADEPINLFDVFKTQDLHRCVENLCKKGLLTYHPRH